MPKYSKEFKERAREVRDAYLDGFEDKTDPRYIILKAQVAEDDARAGRKAPQPTDHLAR